METLTKNLHTGWQICLMVMLSVVVIMLPQYAFASSVTSMSPMSNALCIAATWITGNTGRGIATIGIAIVGFGALLGKVSWGMAMIVGVGVAIMFGSSAIIHLLGGTAAASGNVGTTNCT
jgi:type IV secretory pathway VirB2 component (pilin)